MPDPHPLRLDRSKYFSSVHGEFQSPTHYYQDGLPFDALGHLVVAECSKEQLAAADAKAPRSVPSKPGDKDSPPNPLAASQPALTEGEVNLELWAKGQARYVPGEVFAAIRERYSKSVTTFADAIEFLVNEAKLIPPEQASKQLLGQGGAAPVKEEA